MDLEAAVADLSELKKLAGGATPGPWSVEGNAVYVLHGEPPRNRFSALVQSGRRDDAQEDELHTNAAYIAAASPEVLLRLIAVAEAAKYVAYSNGFDAAYPDKLEALRSALKELEK
jgi:hypothetical protein